MTDRDRAEASDTRPQEEIARAVKALTGGRLPLAEQLLRSLLARRPNHVVAMRLLAEVAARGGRLGEAEELLRHALQREPAFVDARLNLVAVLHAQNRFAVALAELEQLPASEREQPGVCIRRGAALERLGRHQAAIEEYRAAISAGEDGSQTHLNLGHLLNAVGDRAGAIGEYRRALEISPRFSAAWWSLANLKSYRFDEDEVAAMTALLAGGESGDPSALHFALGKAHGDRGDPERAFRHYAEANRLRSATLHYRPERTAEIVSASREVLTAEFFESRRGFGSADQSPIFIVGLPRSGSTLVEQILASHPAVEGLSELPYMHSLARSLERRVLTETGGALAYPRSLTRLSAPDAARMASLYLELANGHRQSDRPLFIDKMPNNWLHLGLIGLILPKARIIDVRRHPMACGFSNFSQNFAAGQEFTFDLVHLGEHYRQYVDFMRHFDAVRPGVVHRVIHEQLVADVEAETRRMLDYLGLPFDAACLDFHRTARVVATPSAEQVRQPINSGGLDRWKRFERCLSPLKTALGPALDQWQQ